MSFHWSPIARTAPERDAEPAGEPADRPTLRHARRDELEEVRMAHGHVGQPGEPGPGQRRDLGRERRLAGAHDLGDRVADRRRRGRPRDRGGEPMNAVYSSARGSSDRMMNRSRWLTCGSRPCSRAQTTTSRATSARSGVWTRSRPGRVGLRVRHLADERALVADDRRLEVELAREPQRARDHPAGDQADRDAPRRGPRGSPPACPARSSRSSPTSVPSMSRAIRRMGRMGSGVVMLGTS